MKSELLLTPEMEVGHDLHLAMQRYLASNARAAVQASKNRRAAQYRAWNEGHTSK